MKKVFDINHFAQIATIDYAPDLFMLVQIIARTKSCLGLEHLQGMTLEEADEFCKNNSMVPVSSMSDDVLLFFTDEDKAVKLNILEIHRVLNKAYTKFLIQEMLQADTPEKLETIEEMKELVERFPTHEEYVKSEGFYEKAYEEWTDEDFAFVVEYEALKEAVDVFTAQYKKGGE